MASQYLNVPDRKARAVTVGLEARPARVPPQDLVVFDVPCIRRASIQRVRLERGLEWAGDLVSVERVPESEERLVWLRRHRLGRRTVHRAAINSAVVETTVTKNPKKVR